MFFYYGVVILVLVNCLYEPKFQFSNEIAEGTLPLLSIILLWIRTSWIGNIYGKEQKRRRLLEDTRRRLYTFKMIQNGYVSD